MTVDEFRDLIKKIGIRISNWMEFNYLLFSSIIPTEDDSNTQRLAKLDCSEFTELMFKLFNYYSEEFLSNVDFNLFKKIFKIKKRNLYVFIE